MATRYWKLIKRKPITYHARPAVQEGSFVFSNALSALRTREDDTGVKALHRRQLAVSGVSAQLCSRRLYCVPPSFVLSILAKYTFFYYSNFGSSHLA